MAGFYEKRGKRAFDLVVSSISIIAVTPVLAVLAVLIRSRIGSPVLFRQVRPGLNGHGFMLVKFRSMSPAIGSESRSLSDSERLEPFGRWLRATSLDELPELWNVVRGQMSLVGPRPLLEAYLPLYSLEQNRRHEIRPGLTGWAQVNGRNSLSWGDKFELDVWYRDNLTLQLDLRILWSTVLGVVKRSGISAEGEATMPPFEG